MSLKLNASDANLKHPRIYVVSLRRAVERRKEIARQLEAYDRCFEFVDAVDAKEVGLETLQAQVDEVAVLRNMGRMLSGPEIGCALSHRKVYQAIVDEGLVGGIILEDDAIIQPIFADLLSYFHEKGRHLSEVPGIYNLYAMSASYMRDVPLRKRFPIWATETLCFYERVNLFSSEVCGTVGYYITYAAAKSLLAVPRIEAAADGWSAWLRRSDGKIYVSSPAVIIHPPDETESYIQETREIMAARLPSGSGTERKKWLAKAIRLSRKHIRRRIIFPIIEMV
ncbi:MAG: glycosyltransferase family 25 protein [Pseudochelatococcus sp.]|jgi:glycosyl transferase family 25|uniref:glycosyltransferase family 25 protein n=1 Tax=Pseudochelatococcus sp. TaxID=2020869 RepID=UPI003D9495BE